MIKSILTTIAVMFVFFIGAHFALSHTNAMKDIMGSFGCDYSIKESK